jgi:alkylhydroperoxidase family enzyme
MSTTPPVAPALIAILDAHAPAVARAISAFNKAVWEGGPSAILELCQARMASLLGARTPRVQTYAEVAKLAAVDRWPDSPLFDEAERACLAFAELWVVQVSSISDEDAARVRGALGDAAFHAFVNGLLALDQQLRLELGLLAVLGEGGPAVSAPGRPTWETTPPERGRRLPPPAQRTDGSRGTYNAAIGAGLDGYQEAVVLLDRLDPVLTELVRLRCARYHDCHT